MAKFIEPPLSRLNSSGRISINGGSATNTPRYHESSDHYSSHVEEQSTPEFLPQSPDKDRQLKKILSEIEYLKFRFSKMSNDISSLKSRDSLHELEEREIPLRRDNLQSNSKEKFEDDRNGQSVRKWTLSRQGDSPLVRIGSGDHSKPVKRQSPSSYGLSPPTESSMAVYSFDSLSSLL